MAAMSDYLEAALLDHITGNGAFAVPSGLYVALFLSDPTDAAGGTEVSTGGYARQAATFGAATSGAGTTSNTGAVAFSAVGANFGSITHVAIFDAATAGNMLFHVELAAPVTVNDGDTLTFPVGNLELSAA